MPRVTAENTSGMTIILIALMKASPSGLKAAAQLLAPGNMSPTATPMIMPIRIWIHSAGSLRLRGAADGACNVMVPPTNEYSLVTVPKDYQVARVSWQRTIIAAAPIAMCWNYYRQDRNRA